MKFLISYIITLIVACIAFFYAPSDTYGSEKEYIQKGMSYVTWTSDAYSSSYSDASLKKLTSLGVRYIAVIVTQYQDAYNSTEIKPSENTPSIDSVSYVIDKAHKLGLKVMLKPHIDILGQSTDAFSRADIGFNNDADWKKWFKSYEDFILAYARLAENLDVKIFCVGTELSFTAQKEASWRKIISKVRNVYSGKLVYAANWDDYKDVQFWDDLDYVGIDAYFPLAQRMNPSLNELIRGWEKWKGEIKTWHDTIKKPIIFTEIGYPSSAHAPITPWENGSHGNPDLKIQAECYTAFFKTIWGCSWLKGVYWWEWGTNIYGGGKHNRSFTPQNKPAEEIIKTYYKS